MLNKGGLLPITIEVGHVILYTVRMSDVFRHPWNGVRNSLPPFLYWVWGDKTGSGGPLSWQQTNQWSYDDIGGTKETWTLLKIILHVLFDFLFFETCMK